MAKTFNRQPLQFDTVDSNAVMFTQSNWKGIIENKNFFAVDQESFEDCENVYINESNVLSSRPVLSNIFNDDTAEYHKTNSHIVVYRRYELDTPERPRFQIISIAGNELIVNAVSVNVYLPRGEKLYFYELGDKIIAFGEIGIYKIDNNFSMTSALGDLYLPYKGDVGNKLMTGERFEETYDGDTDVDTIPVAYNEFLHVKANNVSLAWPYETDTLKNVLLNKVQSEIPALGDGELVIIDNIPYWFEFTLERGDYLYIHKYNLLTGAVYDLKTTISSQASFKTLFKYKTREICYIIAYIPGTISSQSPVNVFELNLRDLTYTLLGNIAPNETISRLIDVYLYNNTVHVLFTTKYSLDSIDFYHLIDGACTGVNNSTYKSLLISNKEFFRNEHVYLLRFKSAKDVYHFVSIDNRNVQVKYYNTASTATTVTHNNYYESDVFDVVDDDFYLYCITRPNLTKNFEILKNGAYQYNINLYDRIDGHDRFCQYLDEDDVYYGFSFSLLDKLPIASRFLGAIRSVFKNKDGIWVLTTDGLYTTLNSNVAEHILPSEKSELVYKLSYTTEGIYRPLDITDIINIGDEFVISNNVSYLMLEQDGQIYIPETKYNNFYENIDTVIPISNDSFLTISKNSVWQVRSTGKLDDKNLPMYEYVKSKLNFNFVENSKSIIGYDGSTVLVPTYQGLGALTYNQIVSVQEQTIRYLSDNIHKLWLEFVSSTGVGFCNYKYYLFVYVRDDNRMLVYDYRNASWWKWKLDKPIKFVTNLDNRCFIGFESSLMYLDEDTLINSWYFKSQRLHLDAPLNEKTIKRFVIHSNGNQNDEMTANVNFTVYRKRMFEEREETMNFEIDFLRTYVKHVNYPKVLYFQYQVSNNELEPKLLQLTGVGVEYVVGGKIK